MAFEEYSGEVIPIDGGQFEEYTGEVIKTSSGGAGRGYVNPTNEYHAPDNSGLTENAKIAKSMSVPEAIVERSLQKAKDETLAWAKKNGIKDDDRIGSLYQQKAQQYLEENALRHKLDFSGITDTLTGLKASDALATWGTGSGSLVRGLGELVGSDTLRNAGNAATEYYADMYSDALKNDLSPTAGVIKSVGESSPGMALGLGAGALMAKGGAMVMGATNLGRNAAIASEIAGSVGAKAPMAARIAMAAPQAAGLALGESSVSALSGADQAAQEFDAVLKEKGSTYLLETERGKELLAEYGDKSSALTALRNEAINQGAALQAAGTAVGSVLVPGMDSRVIGKVLGKEASITGKGLADKAVNVGRESVQEFIQGYGESVGGNIAAQNTYDPTRDATDGALVNASMSGIAGAIHSGAPAAAVQTFESAIQLKNQIGALKIGAAKSVDEATAAFTEATSSTGLPATAPVQQQTTQPLDLSSLRYEQRADGTLKVFGDPEQIKTMFPGERILPQKDGVVFGRSRAYDVMTAIDPESSGVYSSQESAQAIASSAPADAGSASVMQVGEQEFTIAPPETKETVGELRENQLAVSNLAAALPKSDNPELVTSSGLFDTAVDSGGRDAVQRAATSIELVSRVTQSAFGWKPVAIRGISGYGVTYGGKAFINVDAIAGNSGHDISTLVTYTIGHEGMHVLERSKDAQEQADYQAFRKVVLQYAKQDAINARVAEESAFDDAQDRGESEVVADASGAMWQDPKFWSRLYDIDNGSTMRRIAYRFMQAATRFMGALRKSGSRQDLSKLLKGNTEAELQKSIEAVREAAAQVWAQKAMRNGKAVSRTTAKQEVFEAAPQHAYREEFGSFNLDAQDDYSGEPLSFRDMPDDKTLEWGRFSSRDRNGNRTMTSTVGNYSIVNDEEGYYTAYDKEGNRISQEYSLEDAQQQASLRYSDNMATQARIRADRERQQREADELAKRQNIVKSIQKPTEEKIKKAGVTAEDAVDLGAVLDEGGELKIDVPTFIDAGSTYAYKESDGRYSPRTGLDGSVSFTPSSGGYTMSKDGATNYMKRMIAGNFLKKEGFDLASIYRKSTIQKIADKWKQLAKAENVFKYGTKKTSATDFIDAAQDMGIDFKGYRVDAAGHVVIFTRLRDGRNFNASVSEYHDTVEVCTMGLAGFEHSTGFYAVMGQIAKNKGLKFYPDSVLSTINTYRRTEQAFSFALKTGDTGTLLVGPQNRVHGYNFEPKTQQDHDTNLARLALANYRNVKELIPEIDRWSYDPSTDTFTDRHGKSVEDKVDAAIGNKEKGIAGDADVRALGVGRSTLARAALTRMIIHGDPIIDSVERFEKPAAYARKDEGETPLGENYGDPAKDGSEEILLNPEFEKLTDGESLFKGGERTQAFYEAQAASVAKMQGRDPKVAAAYVKKEYDYDAALEKKFERLRRFHIDRDDIVSRIHEDARNGKEEAIIMRLITRLGFRIGGEGSTDGQPTFGAATLRPEHVTVNGDHVIFDFRGKSGVQQRHEIIDPEIANDLRDRLDRDRLFNKADRAVRRYHDSIIRGADYKVHDHRTWVATDAARRVVEALPQPENLKELRAAIELAGSVAATKIGDDLDTALKSYVDPKIFAHWKDALGVNTTGVRGSDAGGEAQSDAPRNTRAAGRKNEAPVQYARREQVDTPEFKRWFGDSKVVDADGKPLVVYHGTPKVGFTEFGAGNVGAFFSDRFDVAASYAGRYNEVEFDEEGAYTDDGTDQGVYQTYLRIENPLVIDWQGKDWGDGPDGLKLDEWANKAKRAGNDGLIVENVVDTGWRSAGLVEDSGIGTVYVTFSPTQIKSAIGNNGQFDPENPDIRYARRDDLDSTTHLYSALARGIDGLSYKQLPANAWKDAVKSLLNKGLVKADEVEWTGINDWLELQQGKVTKEQVQEFLNGNGVQVHEVKFDDAVRMSPELRAYIRDNFDDNNITREVLEGVLEYVKQDLKDVRGFKDSEIELRAIRDEAKKLLKNGQSEFTTTKYFKYTLPGGENYREVLLTLPEKPADDGWKIVKGPGGEFYIKKPDGSFHMGPHNEPAYWSSKSAAESALAFNRPKNTYKSSHWDQPNVLAHIRVNDRTDTQGNKVLFVEEVQSDFGQDGNAKGFVGQKSEDESLLMALKEKQEKSPSESTQKQIANLEKRIKRDDYSIPVAPFVTKTDSWLNLALKRVITMAVQEGYDKVAFVNGEQSADRYDLSNQIASIAATRTKDGKYTLLIEGGDGGVDVNRRGVTEDDLESLIGKELAQKIVSDTSGKKKSTYLSGLDMQVGGEGMKAFYDKIVPAAVKKLVPKLGGELGVVRMEHDPNTELDKWEPEDGEGDGSKAPVEQFTQPGFTITNAMREKVSSEGLPMFARMDITGDTGRQYTPDQLQSFDRVGFRTKMPTWLEAQKDRAIRFMSSYKQGIFDQFQPIAEIDREAYNLMRLSKGASGAFETLLNGGMLKLTDQVYDFDADNRGGVVERLLVPLNGEHHDFMRWVAANRAERLLKLGKENLFTRADIDAIKSLSDGETDFDYTLKHGPKQGQTTRNRLEIYKDSLVEFNKFNRNVMDLAEESGLIDPEGRKVWEHEFYVPFYRVTAEEGFSGAKLKSGVVKQKAFQSLKGGKDKLNADLLDNTLMNWAHLLDASAKNRAAKAALEAAEDIGVAIEADQSVLAQVARSIGKSSQSIVYYLDEGAERFYLVEDRAVLDALTAIQYAGMRNFFMDAMSSAKHWLTVGVTASPYFKIRNLIRDSLQAVAISNLSYNPLSNIRNGFALTNRSGDMHWRLLAGGGTIHFGTMLEGSEGARVQALVEAGVPADSILDSPHKIRAFIRHFIEPAVTAYNELGNRGEEINRAALYDQLIKQGVSHQEASLQARDLMDFSMAGTWPAIRFLAQVVPFFNARLQGMYKLGRGASENPARFSAVLMATAMASLALLAAYKDDEDWKEREEWDRNNFWWFKVGGKAIRIPKPFEIGAIATLAERGAELWFDNEMTSRRFFDQVKTLLADNLSMNPVPQLLKPINDIYANKDSFSGRPIETMAMQKLDPSRRFTSDTSMAARGVSSAMEAVAGSHALSPVQIDHLVRGYFGWLGSFVVGAGDTIARPATNQPTKPTPDYWKVATGGMVADKDSGSSRYVTQVYEQAQELEQAYATFKDIQKRSPSEAADYASKNAEKLSKYKRVEGIKQAEGRIGERIRAIERSNMSAEQKRDLIRQLQEQRNQVAKSLR